MFRQRSDSQRGPVLFEGLADTEFQSRLASTTDTKPQPQTPDFDPEWRAGVLTGNEPKVAADLLATMESSRCSDDQHKGQRARDEIQSGMTP
jgi:hypothetical protein